jgi:isochorismate pyruvate lyase
MKLVKNPKDCENISEIRDAIDRIDREIIELFAKRHAYVKEIVKFKDSDEGIVALERKKQVLKQRRAWAEEAALDPGMMEDVFKLLIEKNIQMQFELYNKKDKK